MHFAIDDTYGPEAPTVSRYVTGERRTHVGVIFSDQEVDYVRGQVKNCLDYAGELLSDTVTEFHFVDLFNRKPPWNRLPAQMNLSFFEFFCKIYGRYRWPVILSTVDKRTLADHRIREFKRRVDGLDLSKMKDLSLFLLCLKLKVLHKASAEPLQLYIDEGRRRPGNAFGTTIFRDWPMPYSGLYASSRVEPLLQLADFVAFCVNRSTHLQMKAKRTEVDNWFLAQVGNMEINSPDLRTAQLPLEFGAAEFDELHRLDRIEKRLEE
jgi:hypothetical protein